MRPKSSVKLKMICEKGGKKAKNSRKPLARMTYQYTLNQPRDFQTFHGQYCSKYHVASSANHKKKKNSSLGLVGGDGTVYQQK